METKPTAHPQPHIPYWRGFDLTEIGLVQSTRGYLTKMVGHYTEKWVPENEFESFERPVWPMIDKFGPLDSGRADVKYENFRGHKLDRKMLELLRAQ